MTGSDWAGVVFSVVLYGGFALAVWWLGWRTVWSLVCAIPDHLARWLEHVARQLDQGARARRHPVPVQAPEPAPEFCTAPLGVRGCCPGGDLVPVESVVTGEVVTERCPTCWLPRNVQERVTREPDPHDCPTDEVTIRSHAGWGHTRCGVCGRITAAHLPTAR